MRSLGHQDIDRIFKYTDDDDMRQLSARAREIVLERVLVRWTALDPDARANFASNVDEF